MLDGLIGPEAVIYDTAQGVYFVSNVNGTIEDQGRQRVLEAERDGGILFTTGQRPCVCRDLQPSGK